MSTIHCPAGHKFSDGLIPPPHGWKLISEEKLENAYDQLLDHVDDREKFDLQVGLIVNDKNFQAYVCPECGRLLVFTGGLSKPTLVYAPESAAVGLAE